MAMTQEQWSAEQWAGDFYHRFGDLEAGQAYINAGVAELAALRRKAASADKLAEALEGCLPYLEAASCGVPVGSRAEALEDEARAALAAYREER